MKNQMKKLHNLVFDREYMTARAVRFAQLSIVLNAMVALGKIGMGIYSLSLFVCVNGFYNIGIAIAKQIMVKSHGEQEKRKHYKLVGLIIFITNVIYLLYCGNLAIRGQSTVSYDVITSITIATFSFTEMGMAVYGVIVVKKEKDLTLVGIKRINLTVALISIVLTQSALLSTAGTENAARYCGWLGIIFGALAAIAGLFMVFEMRRK